MDKVAVSWILLTSFSLFATVLTQENVIRFQSNEIKEIVDTHNDLRRSIYNAANMRELTWNEAVAFAASEWGTRCEYVSRPDNQWGQNMNYFYGRDTTNSSMDLFRDSFRAWSNETRHYDYRRYRYCGSKNVCSYVQLIAADVQEVGCAIVKCPKLQLQAPTDVQQHAKLLICFYTPWVNILGTEVFIPEERCTACPMGTTCVDNLCSARFYQTGSRTIPIGSTSVKIEPISGTRPSVGGISISGISETRPSPSQPTSEERQQTTVSSDPGLDRRHGGRHRNREHRNQHKEDRVVGSHNSFGSSKTDDENRVYHEHRGSPASYAIKTSNETIVVYTPNNRVIPFPGKSDRKTIRQIEKFEKKVENDLDQKQERIMHSLELIANNITVANVSSQQRTSRKKRQASFQDAVYLRRLEYERYLREYENLVRERQERRRQYEEELRRREHHNNQVQELRRAQELTRYNDEMTRYNNEVERRRQQQQLLQDRRRYEALALTQNQGDLTGEEQFFTISAHNLLRREAGAKDLAWSSHLERWAKYVIRCETEYPGPITCYTNFGKSEAGDEIYNVVYQWGAEGSDLNRPLRYGCRTPSDRSLCNHYSIIRTKSLTQMACAAKNCGSQRQLTCIYSDG